jgi:hypothetical protein
MADATTPDISARSPAPRSRVTAGKALFADGTGDMRLGWARRMRDIFETHISDMGGDDAVSEAERSIARRAAVLTTELERMEALFAIDDAPDGMLDLYQRTANSLRRMLETLGLKRRAKDVTPDLRTYLASRTKTNPEPPEGQQ